MNGKERLASVILAVTLAIGIISTKLNKERIGGPVPEAAHRPGSETCYRPADSYLKLNINAATAGQLMTLPGIGPTKADAIVEWRRTNGPFTDVEQLVAVRGVGCKTLDRIRKYFCVDREDLPIGD